MIMRHVTLSLGGAAMLAMLLALTGCPGGNSESLNRIDVDFSGGAPTQPQSLAITTTNIPNGQVTQQYSSQVQAIGGTQPYTYIVSTGALPSGVALSARTGILSGTPTASGTFRFTIRVSDVAQPVATASREYTLVINQPGGGAPANSPPQWVTYPTGS
jgi:hypothetical protein